MRQKLIIGLLAFLLMNATAQADETFEERLFQIYQNYQSKPITDETWKSQFSELSEDEYQVQSGDTLWDISKIFFGDGYYWSKLWSVNGKEITNPHLIEPGTTLKFLGGNFEQGPKVLAEGNEEGEKNTAMQTDEGSVVLSTQDLPSPAVQKVPILRALPSSFSQHPEGHIVSVKRDFLFEPRPAFDDSVAMALTSYVVDKKPDTVGKIVENEIGNEVAGLYQTTYIEVQGQIDIGEKLTVIEYKPDLEFPLGDLNIVRVLGQVTLTDFVEGEPGRYRALVTQAVQPILKNAELVTTPLQRVGFEKSGPMKGIDARIIGGMALQDQNLFSSGQFVYLDKGRNDGLAVGDLLGVTQGRTMRLEDPIIKRRPGRIGLLKVVHCEGAKSTAMVIDQSEDIRSGDYMSLQAVDIQKDHTALDDFSDEENEIGPRAESSDHETSDDQIDEELSTDL